MDMCFFLKLYQNPRMGLSFSEQLLIRDLENSFHKLVVDYPYNKTGYLAKCVFTAVRDYIDFTSDLDFPLFNPLICGQFGAEIRFLFIFLFCLSFMAKCFARAEEVANELISNYICLI